MKNVILALFLVNAAIFWGGSAHALAIYGGEVNAPLNCSATDYICVDGSDAGAYTSLNSNFDAADIASITTGDTLYETFTNETPYSDGLVFDIGLDADFFYVKDGANTPMWYVFDIASMASDNWDGIVTLTGVWFGVSDNDAISHVAAYSGTPTSVPEPSVAGLLGIGLLGMIGVARRKTVA